MKILHHEFNDLFYWETETHKNWLGFMVPDCWDLNYWEILICNDIWSFHTPWVYFTKIKKQNNESKSATGIGKQEMARQVS